MAFSESQTTRRLILQSGVTGVSALAALPAISTRCFAAGDGAVRIGLIGTGARCGGLTSAVALSLLNGETDVKFMSLGGHFDFDVAKTNGTIERLGVKSPNSNRYAATPETRFAGFDSHKRVIDSGVDAVMISAIPGFIPTYFEYAVQKGKHVYLHMPVAVDAAGIRRMKAANAVAKEKGLKVTVMMSRRFHPRAQATIAKIVAGEIGKVRSMQMYWNGGRMWSRSRSSLFEQLGREPTEMEYQIYNWYYFTWLSGDLIVEQHSKNLLLANWLLGEAEGHAHPVGALGMGGRISRTGADHGQIYDHYAVEYLYPDGIHVNSQCRQISNSSNMVGEFAQGTKGNANFASGRISDLQNQFTWRYRSESADPYKLCRTEFVDAVANDKPLNHLDLAINASMTAILGRYAAQSGKRLRWTDALAKGRTEFPYDKELAWQTPPPVLPDEDGNYPVAKPGEYEALE